MNFKLLPFRSPKFESLSQLRQKIQQKTLDSELSIVDGEKSWSLSLLDWCSVFFCNVVFPYMIRLFGYGIRIHLFQLEGAKGHWGRRVKSISRTAISLSKYNSIPFLNDSSHPRIKDMSFLRLLGSSNWNRSHCPYLDIWAAREHGRCGEEAEGDWDQTNAGEGGGRKDRGWTALLPRHQQGHDRDLWPW